MLVYMKLIKVLPVGSWASQRRKLIEQLHRRSHARLLAPARFHFLVLFLLFSFPFLSFSLPFL